MLDGPIEIKLIDKETLEKIYFLAILKGRQSEESEKVKVLFAQRISNSLALSNRFPSI